MMENPSIIVDEDVPCKLRDGTILYSNIYRPQTNEAYPVLLTRHPYNKNLPDFSHRYVDPLELARSGYVVIIQDVRGRFASEGEFQPFIQEPEDGYDTVEWAANLSYSDGNVGMFGLSYYGFTQLYAASERPPSLKAIFPAMSGRYFYDAIISTGSIFHLGLFTTWLLDSVAPDYLNRIQNPASHMKTIHQDLNRIFDWYSYKPMKDWPPLHIHPSLGKLFTCYLYANERIIDEAHRKSEAKALDLPAYHLAGWYDCFLESSLKNYQEMKESSTVQKLIVGPWSHGNFQALVGERFFGNQSSGSSIDHKVSLTSLHIKWFDRWLKNQGETELETEPVHLFIMGVNEWRGEQEWPLARTKYTPYYLSSDGNAHQYSANLTPQLPSSVGYDSYIYDPENPVSTRGGGTLFYLGMNSGPVDQQDWKRREDILVYTSSVLEEPLEVTGPVKVILYAASDVPSTDFTAKLIDVCPEGNAYNLTDGINRVAVSSGEVQRYEIEIGSTSNVFLPGHSLRVEISSSSFPQYDVNPNTGGSTLESTEMQQARQVIYHGEKYPSHILLPVIAQI